MRLANLNGWQRIFIVFGAVGLLPILSAAYISMPTRGPIVDAWVQEAKTAYWRAGGNEGYFDGDLRRPEIDEAFSASKMDLILALEDFAAGKRSPKIEGDQKMGTCESSAREGKAPDVGAALAEGEPPPEVCKLWEKIASDPEYLALPLKQQLKIMGQFASKYHVTVGENFHHFRHPTNPTALVPELSKIRKRNEPELRRLLFEQVKTFAIFLGLGWVLPLSAVYALGYAVGWIRDGFRRKKIDLER